MVEDVAEAKLRTRERRHSCPHPLAGCGKTQKKLLKHVTPEMF
jgi:hypothetical protein